jgi:hypothetical protein
MIFREGQDLERLKKYGTQFFRASVGILKAWFIEYITH